MKFAVIYEVNTPDDADPDDHAPPAVDELWTQTEGDDSYEVPDRYAADAAGADARGWRKGRHRKWCADLTEEQFDEFAAACHLSVAGEGSALGAVGLGMTKAIVFAGHDDDDVMSEAFVTPNCNEAEVADWLRAHGQSVPASLTDAPGQRYLFRGMKDRRTPWEAVVRCLEAAY